MSKEQEKQEICISSLSSLCTFNILAEQLACEKLFNHTNPNYLKWNYRKDKILRYVSSTNISCLQEVSIRSMHDHFALQMKARGYSFVFIPKSTRQASKYYQGTNVWLHSPKEIERKPNNSVLGNAIFWKTDKYDVVRSGFIPLTNLWFDLPEEWSSNDKKLFSQPQCVPWVLLKCNLTHTFFMVASVHLVANPSLPHIKLAQSIFLMKSLHQEILSIKTGNNEKKSSWSIDVPIIIAGDFNSTPDSSVYKFMIGQKLTEKDLAHDLTREMIEKFPYPLPLQHTFNVSSAHTKIYGREPYITNHVKSFSGCLDYVFYTQPILKSQDQSQVDNFVSCSADCLFCSSPDELVKQMDSFLPNQYHPSDHLPIYTNFSLSTEFHLTKE